jgi:mycoredoxin
MSRDIVVYTRPGCPYCFRLRRGLRRQGMPFNEVNIWQDRAAAADVRANASGNETVPTVRLGDRWLVNPTAAQVRAAAGHPDQKVRTFRMTTWERIGNAIAGVEGPRIFRIGNALRFYLGREGVNVETASVVYS